MIDDLKQTRNDFNRQMKIIIIKKENSLNRHNNKNSMLYTLYMLHERWNVYINIYISVIQFIYRKSYKKTHTSAP